ncbi:hypothetical protein Droror1_Dr00012118, partial [Drosera rotundifolia]
MCSGQGFPTSAVPSWANHVVVSGGLPRPAAGVAFMGMEFRLFVSCRSWVSCEVGGHKLGFLRLFNSTSLSLCMRISGTAAQGCLRNGIRLTVERVLPIRENRGGDGLWEIMRRGDLVMWQAPMFSSRVYFELVMWQALELNGGSHAGNKLAMQIF